MSTNCLLIIFFFSITTTRSYEDAVPAPKIIINPNYTNIATPVTMRCESNNFIGCEFYKDNDAEPIRKVNKNACQKAKLEWKEFNSWNQSTVDLSCTTVHEINGENITSKRSEAKQLYFGDPIGKPNCYVETTQSFFTLRCEAKHGTTCYFYMNNQAHHFKSNAFRNGGCLMRVSQEDMKKQISNSITASITCEVEILVEGFGSVKSVTKSESVNINIYGEKDAKPTPTMNSPENSSVGENTGLHSSPTDPSDFIPQSHLYLGVSVGSILLLLMALFAFYCHRKKHGHKEGTSARTETVSEEPQPTYAVVTIKRSRPDDNVNTANDTVMEVEEVSDLYAAVVKRPKGSHGRPKTKAAASPTVDDNVVYSAIMYH